MLYVKMFSELSDPLKDRAAKDIADQFGKTKNRVLNQFSLVENGVLVNDCLVGYEGMIQKWVAIEANRVRKIL